MNKMVHVNSEVIKRRPRPYIANGDKIKQLRKRAGGASQEHFAAVAGISRRYWVQLESGEKLPTAKARNKVADALNCDPSEIRSSDDEDEDSDPMESLARALIQIAREAAVDAARAVVREEVKA